MVAAINQVGSWLNADLLAWGALVISLSITYAAILYVQRLLRA